MNQTKTCCKCKQELDISSFGRNKRKSDGLQPWCKPCRNEDAKRQRKLNPEYNFTWKKDNPDKVKKHHERYRKANPELVKLVIKRWKLLNKEKVSANVSKRRATQLNATPKWLTKEDLLEIEKFYFLSRMLEKETGEKHHVDHIVPLNNPLVCGLHVPWNLQILKAKENLIKSNKFDI